MVYSKQLAVNYLKRYRQARKRAGGIDEQMIVGTGLNMGMCEINFTAVDHGY